MTVEITGDKARVSVGYSLKVPHEVDYATEDAHVSFSIEFPVEGNVEAVLEQLEAVQAQLMNSVKMATFAQLGVEFEMSSAGVVAPIIKAKAKAAAAPRQANGGGGGGYRGGGGGQRAGGGQGNYAPPKAAGRTVPTVSIGGIAYKDQRPLKEDGTYAPGAADFRSIDKIDGQNKQLWLYTKDGELNQGTADLLEAAGIAW